MSTHRRPAHPPAGSDPSARRSPLRRARALGAPLLLAFAVLGGCQRPIPLGAPAEGGTRTRARGEEAVALDRSGDPSSSSPSGERARANASGPATTAEPAAAPPAPAAGSPETPAATAARVERVDDNRAAPGEARVEAEAERAPPGDAPAPHKLAEAKGLGLVGLGAGGAGLGVGSAGLGVGSAGHGAGRMGNVARPAVRAAQAPMVRAAAPILPGAGFDTEAYDRVTDHPWKTVADAPLSTFSVDVDTASYSNMRRFVRDGALPPRDSIRVEEWVNYFPYDDAAPGGAEPLRVSTELTDCPWAPEHQLLRVALTTRPIEREAIPPRNLVFLIDVSGSMMPPDKLPLLRRGLALLARELRPVDSLAIAVYAGSSGLVLPPTSGAEQGKILEALERLEAGGSTNGAEGIELAYRVAESARRPGINRVILATDGDFNVGVTSRGELDRLIEKKRQTGVFLTVLGFGTGNVKDATMEALADRGNGNYAYIDDLAEARKVLVREAGATLVTVAGDVKLQVELNPAKVASYRLVGYENRALADQDFNDDRKDAGEMGAGHRVTAFYELVPPGSAAPLGTKAVDPLRYQSGRAPTAASQAGELGTVKLRWKSPGGGESRLLVHRVEAEGRPLAEASERMRFGAAVAQYALTLRGAHGVDAARLPVARRLAEGALGRDATGERREFLTLMDRAARL